MMGLINREDFERLAESMKDGLAKNRSWDFCNGFAFALELLRTMPEQKQDRIVGVVEWVPSDLDPDFITCSNCGPEKLKFLFQGKWIAPSDPDLTVGKVPEEGDENGKK